MMPLSSDWHSKRTFMVLARFGGLFDSIKRDLMEYIHMEFPRLQAGVVEECLASPVHGLW